MNSKQSIEEAAKEYADSTNINFIDHTYCIKDFKAGAAWQLEQLKAQEQKPVWVSDDEIGVLFSRHFSEQGALMTIKDFYKAINELKTKLQNRMI